MVHAVCSNVLLLEANRCFLLKKSMISCFASFLNRLEKLRILKAMIFDPCVVFAPELCALHAAPLYCNSIVAAGLL